MHIRGFDGLRALAMLLVFFTHKTAWGAQAEIGFSGVWLFFLLSGFLIGGQLWTARATLEAGTSTFRHELVLFWLKRAMRIFPAYYVVILLVAPFYLATARPIPGLPYYLGYLSNFYFQQHPPEFLTTWAHFWSLAVEEQFYVLFAPLMLLVPSRHASTMCLLLVVAALVQRFGLASVGVEPFVIYIDSLVNFGLLAFGVLLFIHRGQVGALFRTLHLQGSFVGWCAMAALVASAPVALMVAGANLVVLQISYVCAALVAAVLLMNVLGNQDSPMVALLEWRPISYFGRISYGLYLFNDYVKNDIPERLLRWAASHGWLGGGGAAPTEALLGDGSATALALQAAGLITCFGLLFALAHLSWIGIERPALRIRNRFVRSLDARLAPPAGRVEERLNVAPPAPATIR